MLVRIFAISAFILVGASMHSSIAAEVQDYPGLGRIQGYKYNGTMIRGSITSTSRRPSRAMSLRLLTTRTGQSRKRVMWNLPEATRL